jgi:hypothetical protein
MARTYKKVRYTPKGKAYTAVTAAQGVEERSKSGGSVEADHSLSPVRREGSGLASSVLFVEPGSTHTLHERADIGNNVCQK